MARRNRPAADSNPGTSERHYPSAPSRPPVVCIYCSREDNPDKILITTWATWEGAASFFEYLIKDQEDEPKWLKHKQGRWTQLVWSSGLVVTCRSDELLERLCETETDWTLPEPDRGRVTQFLSNSPVVGSDHERRPKTRGEEKPKREPKEKKPAGPKAPAGWLHVSELVPDVEAPHARAALRKLGWAKPAFGWWFDPKRKDEVAKAIKGALK